MDTSKEKNLREKMKKKKNKVEEIHLANLASLENLTSNDADIIWINNQIGNTMKFLCFWQNFNMLISHKGF